MIMFFYIIKKKMEKKDEKFLLEIKEKQKVFDDIKTEIHKKVVWQDELIETLLVALFTNWHILLEWVPWIAKTLAVDTLSKTLHWDFKRIQFTPDLLPADLLWTEIFNQWKNSFEIKKWPIFTNFLLSDEINRASPKVQSALLESMAENQITIWEETFKLDYPFLVLATQNPIEQSWTYKLPEAQLDRFMLKIKIWYPTKKEEFEIMKNIYKIETIKIKQVLTKKELKNIQELSKKIYVSENIFEYINNIVFSTRNPDDYWLWDIKKYVEYWVSPRWSISMLKASQAKAMLEWRDFVIPEDIKDIAKNILSHRLVLTYEAIADNIKAEELIKKILETVPIV